MNAKKVLSDTNKKFSHFGRKLLDVHLLATEKMFTLAGIVPTVRSYWVFLSSVIKKLSTVSCDSLTIH